MTTHPNAESTRFLVREEGSIAYDITGAGRLIVLVPGMGDLRSSYRHLTPLLVAAGYRVVTADLRGHGESSATFSSYNDVDTASDLVALIEELGEPAVIAGNSMAAGAAVIAAASHPQLIDGLVLIGPFVRMPKANAFELFMFRAAMMPLWAAPAWKAYLPKLYAGKRPADFDVYLKEVIAGIRRPGYAKAFSKTTHTSHDPAEAVLSEVKKPTLVVMGELDPDFKTPESEAKWIVSALNASLVMVPESGHYPQSQQPEITATAITEFLGTIPAHA